MSDAVAAPDYSDLVDPLEQPIQPVRVSALYRLALLLVAVLSIGCASSPDSHSRTPLADAQKIETLVDDVQARNTLHPDLWQEGKLDPLVRERLLKMAELFLLDTGFGNLDVKEIVFAGSMAGYLYHSQSDIDVHVSVDGSPITTDLKLLFQLYLERRSRDAERDAADRPKRESQSSTRTSPLLKKR